MQVTKEQLYLKYLQSHKRPATSIKSLEDIDFAFIEVIYLNKSGESVVETIAKDYVISWLVKSNRLVL